MVSIQIFDPCVRVYMPGTCGDGLTVNKETAKRMERQGGVLLIGQFMCYEIGTKHKERSQYHISMPAPLRHALRSSSQHCFQARLAKISSVGLVTI